MNSIQRVNALAYSYRSFADMHTDYYRVYRYFQSGKFDTINNADATEDLKEIKQIQKEIINLWIKNIKNEKHQYIARDINPVYVMFLLMSTTEGMLNMNPVMKEVLESEGINIHSFIWNDFPDFVFNLISKEKIN